MAIVSEAYTILEARFSLWVGGGAVFTILSSCHVPKVAQMYKSLSISDFDESQFLQLLDPRRKREGLIRQSN